MSTNAKEGEFIQGLGLFDATMVVAGSMIGSGIFIVSVNTAKIVNNYWLLLLVWLLTGVMTIIGALSYAELAAALPKAGGVYVYLKEAWNELVGFVFGWTLLLVIQTGTIAAVAVATAKFLGVMFPWISSANMLINIGNIHILSTEQFVAISSLIILTAINCTGVKSGAMVQNIFTIAKVIALLGLIIVGLFFVSNAGVPEYIANANTYAQPEFKLLFGVASLIAIASVGALFSSDAWFGVTFIAGEIKNPAKVLPLALLLGTGLVTVLYILANVAYLNALGLEGIQFAPEERVGTAIMQHVFGPTGAIVMAIIILVSTIGCNNGLIMAGSRVYWAMAKDNLFFKMVGKIDPKYNTPIISLIVQCTWASILCLSGQYNDLLEYIICTGLVFYILTILCVFRLRKKQPDLPRPYKVIGYPYLPIIYIFMAGFIVLNLLVDKPKYCIGGFLIALTGIPVYLIWKKVNQKREINE
ncbi:MAG: amino acid permease [Cyanobacteriota bacterium]